MKDSFRVFCKQVLSCEELIDLWTDIEKYKVINENDFELKVNSANIIWNSYFVVGSIEVPEELHSVLVDNLNSGNTSLYDEVQSLIEDDLKEEAYHLFINDFIKHAPKSSLPNPLSSLTKDHPSIAPVDDELFSKIVQPIYNNLSRRRRNSLQYQEPITPTKLNSSNQHAITTVPILSSSTKPTPNNEDHTTPIPPIGVDDHNSSPPPPPPPPPPPVHTPPQSCSTTKRGIRVERLGDKIQIYGRPSSATNSLKQEHKHSNLEEYKYKGPLLSPNQEIRATVADIDSSFIRSKGEKEQFTQVTCCEVSVNLLYQKIPIITQGSIEGMGEMAKKLYNLKDYLQNDNDSFVMDINSILNRCDRYSAHLQVENVESINNCSIIEMFKLSERKAICCILKAKVIDQESNSFNDYLVVFYDGNESYCLFHTFEKPVPKKGLRACVTYFENRNVMERFLNDFLVPNELSSSKLSNNRKYILKQLITLRKKEQDLNKKFLNYRVSLQVEDSPLENIEKKLFMMEDSHRNKIEDLINKLKDIEDKIKNDQETSTQQVPPQTPKTIVNEQLVHQVDDEHKNNQSHVEDLYVKDEFPSPRKRSHNNSPKSSPLDNKGDIITDYFINRLTSIESEMNEVKNAYTKRIESVVENLNSRTTTQPVLYPQSENFDHMSNVVNDVKSELAKLKNEMTALALSNTSLEKVSDTTTTTTDTNIKSQIEHQSHKDQDLGQIDEIVERINTIESYAYENMSSVKQAITEEKKERFDLFEALHLKVQSIDDRNKETAKDNKELIEQFSEMKDNFENVKLLISTNPSTSQELDGIGLKQVCSDEINQTNISIDTTQFNNLRKELIEQVHQHVHQQVNQQWNQQQNVMEVENGLLKEYKEQLKNIENIVNNNFENNRGFQEQIDLLERRVCLIESEMKDKMNVDSKIEQINFVNQNFNQVVNIKVESLDEKVEHLKEFVHTKTREMELNLMSVVSSSNLSSSSDEPSHKHSELLQNFVSQLSNMQLVQSNYDEKLSLISKLHDSSWNKTLEQSENLISLSNNAETLKHHTDNKFGQLNSSVKRIDNQIEYLTTKIQQINQQKDYELNDKMTLFINSLSSRVELELGRMNDLFEKKEEELNDKFLELLTRERRLIMREQNLEEREDHFIKHDQFVEVVKKENSEENLLLKQVQHHLNAPQAANSILYPLSKVDSDTLKKQHLNSYERSAIESKDSFLLKTPESLFTSTTTGFTVPNYSLAYPSSVNSNINNNVSTLNPIDSPVNSNTTSPTNSESSSQHYPTIVTSSGMQTFDEDDLLLQMMGSKSSSTVAGHTSPPLVDQQHKNRKSSGSQTYKTQFKEYKKEDTSIIRSPFRKYAEQKEPHLFTSKYF